MQFHAVDIAERYTTDPIGWKDAAANIRQPYWDWARNSLPPDEVIKSEKVKIVRADGPATVDNPILYYRFHPGPDPSFPEPYKNWPTTIRHPTTEDPSTKSDVESLAT